MSTLAIIPARGGSKGIKRKNLVPLCDKPLIAWTIEAALASTEVDEVVVSSDDPEIGRTAEDHGATWILRSDLTASDTASSESAILEVLDVINGQPDLVCFLQATSPLRQAHDIDNAIRSYRESGADSLFSARRLEGYTWTVCGPVVPNYMSRERRQVQSAVRLEENGSIYVFTPESLRKYRNRLGGRIEYYEMHPLDSFQVDTYEDLAMMQTLIPLRMTWLQPATSAA